LSRFDTVQLDVWGVQAEALRRLGRRFLSFQAIYWVVFGPYLVVYALDLFEPLGDFGPSVVLALLMPLGDAAVILLLTGPEDRPLGEVLVGALRLYGRLLMITFLRTLVVAAGLVCGIAPGLFLAARFSLATVVAVEEGEPSPFKALFRSRDIVYGHTLRVAGAFAILVVLSNAGALAVVAVGGVQTDDPAPWTHAVNILIDQLSLTFTALAVVVYGRLASTAPAAPPPPAGPEPAAAAP